MTVIIKTVGDLIRELEKYPQYMNVYGISSIQYNGKIPVLEKNQETQEYEHVYKEGLYIK